ncbi:MAG: PAC2 family protein [Nanoarchaeota archaeon]
MTWTIKNIKDIRMKSPVFIEGLPGIGNVGKIAIDLVIDELKAQKIVDLFSYSLPNSVFVNEDNMVELPKIELFYKKVGKQDFIFLSGDVQPTEEHASYEFAETILNIIEGYGCTEIITLGGIGLSNIPKQPKVYCTGNSKEFMQEFKKQGAHTNIYGVVGPIIGISGLLLGLAKKRKIRAIALLSETYGHPLYIGLAGAKEILNILQAKYKFTISLKELEDEIKEFEKQIVTQPGSGQPIAKKYLKYKDTSYIG